MCQNKEIANLVEISFNSKKNYEEMINTNQGLYKKIHMFLK